MTALQEQARNDAVTEYWLEHYIEQGLCSLCGNSGWIDTTGTKTAAGVSVGRINLCICPNGQSLRAHGAIRECRDEDQIVNRRQRRKREHLLRLYPLPLGYAKPSRSKRARGRKRFQILKGQFHGGRGRCPMLKAEQVVHFSRRRDV